MAKSDFSWHLNLGSKRNISLWKLGHLRQSPSEQNLHPVSAQYLLNKIPDCHIYV